MTYKGLVLNPLEVCERCGSVGAYEFPEEVILCGKCIKAQESYADDICDPADDKGNGSGCTCGAYAAFECACGADWTPSEIYHLRDRIAELEKELEYDPSKIPNLYDAIDEYFEMYQTCQGEDKRVLVEKLLFRPRFWSRFMDAYKPIGDDCHE